MNKKLILFMTSLSLVMAPVSAFASEYSESAVTIEAVENRANLQAATGEYRSWKQYDSRWGSQYLGSSSDTMAESGCLVTAIATLIVHSGCADESNLTPGKLCTYLSNNKGFTSNGELYWDKVTGAVDGFALANWNVTLSGSRYDKVAQIKSYLERGYYIVVSVGYGAHWVAVNSADGDSNINIFDPGYSYTKLFGNYADEGVTRIALFTGNGGGSGIVDGSTGNTTTMETYNATGKVNVGASYLNVRVGAGTDQGLLTDSVGNRITLDNDESVTITGKGNDSSGNLWYRISINGVTGYVYAAYIDITANSGNNNNNGNTTTTEEKAATVNASYVNVRSGAGTSYSVVAVASLNDAVKVTGETTDSSGTKWYKVTYNGTTGYMHSDYVTLDSAGTGNNNNNNNTGYTEKAATVNASSVNVRSGAGTGNSVVATLSLNTSITVTGEAKDSSGTTWYAIKYDGGSGYMHSDYVTIGGSSNGNTSGGTTTQPKTGTVNADYVNVRTGAGTENSRTTSLNSGTAVTITGEAKDSSGDTWYQITYAGGSGYMHSDYVTIGGSNGNTSNSTPTTSYPTEGVAGKEGIISAARVNVRASASSSGEVINILNSGVSVLIEGAERDASGTVWYKVAFAGTSGYIMAEYIEIQ